jgi:hypothetical protein
MRKYVDAAQPPRPAADVSAWLRDTPCDAESLNFVGPLCWRGSTPRRAMLSLPPFSARARLVMTNGARSHSRP